MKFPTVTVDGDSIVITADNQHDRNWLLEFVVAPALVERSRSNLNRTRYEFQAQDARDSERIGYGDEGYWQYLEASALSHAAIHPDEADYYLGRTLTEALAGNNGD